MGTLRSIAGPASAGWLLAAVLAAAVVREHDRLVAVGADRWTIPAATAAIVAMLGVVAVAVQVWYRLRPALGLVLPALVVAELLGGGFESPLPQPASGAAKAPTIVLVTLDTFRADRVGPLTPALTALAADGASFDGVSEEPLTGPSHATMWTGRPPRAHGLVSNGRSLAAGVSTVVPRLHAAGWRTGAFVSAHVLDRHTGLQAGFDHYDDRFGLWQRFGWLPGMGSDDREYPATRRGDATVDRALAWLAEDDVPTLLWVHLYDPHMPYEPPAGYGPPEDALAAARDEDARARASGATASAAHAAEGRLLYDGEIRWTDAQLARVLAAVPEDAVVVVAGDHGESLGEHGYWFNHGARLDDVALRVPLVVRWPGRVAAGAHGGQASLARIAATLLDAAGLGDGTGLESLVPDGAVDAWTPGQENRRDRFGPAGVAAAARRWPTAKVVATKGQPTAFFDLEADPAEDAPLPVPPERAGDAREVEAAAAGAIAGPTDEERARLEALGYVE